MSEAIEIEALDRSQWGDGPWRKEPDRVDFEHAGLPCLLQRNRMGAWCGYAAVPPGHPWHGVQYGACLSPADPAHANDENGWHDCERRPEAIARVHGGLTYSGPCSGAICHVPKRGEPADVWWFGFDCAHFMDLIPKMSKFREEYGLPPKIHMDPRWTEIYRDIAYVRAETERLAEQLAAVAAPGAVLP